MIIQHIGSGNGTVPSCTEPLPEPNVDLDLSHYMVWLGHNELINPFAYPGWAVRVSSPGHLGPWWSQHCSACIAGQEAMESFPVHAAWHHTGSGTAVWEPHTIRSSPCNCNMTSWRHQMETFSAILAICEGNSLVTSEFPHTKASDPELWCFLWSAHE